ncbi:MAG: GNAT family N-acetyltransferase [Clostridia bacterium]|nr:GNAT family N-acetyltransferase [Clostridia bacterium]
MIKSENISLRAIEPHDVDKIFEWENNTEVWHLSNTLAPFSRFEIEQYVLNAAKDIYAARQLRLMIDLTANEKTETIGSVDLFDFDPLNKRAGIGILIDQRKRKNGYASEALGLIIKYAKEILNLHQLYCNIEEDNQISLNLFLKMNFKTIGLKKDWNLRNGNWINEYTLQYILTD